MTIPAVIDAHLSLPVAAVPPEVRARLRADLTLPNPRYTAVVSQGPTGRMSPTVTLYREVNGWAVLPRGYAARALEHLMRAGLEVRVVDLRPRLPDVTLTFRGSLLPYQERAVAALRGSGVLVASPGSGKAVMALAAIAPARQPTLWLLHTRDLAS